MILDTTVLVDLLRGDKKAIARIEALEEAGELLWVPTPVLFELWEGIERADRPDAERRKVEEVLSAYTILSFEPKHAHRAGTLSGALVRRGEMIDPIDAQVAGTGLAEGRPVMTRNTKHFARVEGLAIETY